MRQTRGNDTFSDESWLQVRKIFRFEFQIEFVSTNLGSVALHTRRFYRLAFDENGGRVLRGREQKQGRTSSYDASRLERRGRVTVCLFFFFFFFFSFLFSFFFAEIHHLTK